MDRIDLKVTDQGLHVEKARAVVASADAGGTCVFVGTVRSQTRGKAVRALEFEAFEPMAISEMRKIAEAVLAKWPVLGIAIHHRTGRLEVTDMPVVIAVSAAHRKAAFEACQYCIDTLKETVPIWKKEIFEDGEEWVAAHP